MGFRGLAAKEEHEPLDSHGLLGCRIQAPSHLIPSAALPAWLDRASESSVSSKVAELRVTERA